MEISISDKKQRLKQVRIDLGYKRNKKFCNDKNFNTILKKLNYHKNLTPRHLKYMEEDAGQKKLDILILAFCYKFIFSLKQFYNTDKKEFEEYCLFKQNLNLKKKGFKKKINTEQKIENFIQKNKILLEEVSKEDNTYKKLTNLLERIYFITTIGDKEKYLIDEALAYYESLIKINPILTFKYMSESLREVANRCYLKNKPICPSKMPKTTQNIRVSVNRAFCEDIIYLFSKSHDGYNFTNADFSAMDLRRLFLFNDLVEDEMLSLNDHQINYLKKACFKGTNIAYSVFNGIDLTDACFENVICAKNAHFLTEATILTGANFKNANLVGVNKRYDDNGKGKHFLAKRHYIKETPIEFIEMMSAYCFFDVELEYFDGAKLDQWLKNQLYDQSLRDRWLD